jgi:hypothetical protein
MAVVLQQATTHRNTHITENNKLRSNKTQHTKLRKNKGYITQSEYKAKRKKIKAIRVTGRGGLYGCEMSRIV